MSTDSYWPTVVKCVQQPFRVQDEVKNTDPLDFINFMFIIFMFKDKSNILQNLFLWEEEACV